MSLFLSAEDAQNAQAFLELGQPVPGTERFQRRCQVLMKWLVVRSAFHRALAHAWEAQEPVDAASVLQPQQPFAEGVQGRTFFPNSLVQSVVSRTRWHHAPFLPRFSTADRIQLAQLLGLSLNVFATLPFVDSTTFRRIASAQIDKAPPQQPLVTTTKGVAFQPNALVIYLFKESKMTDQELLTLPAPKAVQAQFFQLLGRPLLELGCEAFQGR